MFEFGDDLAFILGDAGEEVTYTTPAGDVLTTSGVYSEADVVMNTQDGDVVALQRTLVIAQGAFPGLALEEQITRAGVAYAVKDRRSAMSGAAWRLFLVPA